MQRGELFAGRYEIVARLGRGGMGEVWSARDRNLRRDVAVKLLYLDDAGAGDAARRFEREAVAAAQISHPNVAVVHDRGVQEGVLFLVMERIDGTTLSQALRGGIALPVSEAVRIATRICDALLAAHRAGVIHYDIKPHNVMLTVDGTVKVVDFGIAGFVHSQFTVARTSQLAPAGTPEFGAPEQFLEERGDERSDLYALGGVLFCMLTGRPPFQGQNGIAVMLRKRDEVAPRVDELTPGIPPALTELVAELLEREAARRPQTASEVLARLVRIEKDIAAPASVDPGVAETVQAVAAVAPALWVEAGETPPSPPRTSHPPTLPAIGADRQTSLRQRALTSSWASWSALVFLVGVGATTQLAGIGARMVATEAGTGRRWTDEVWQSTQSWTGWTGQLFTSWSHGAAVQIVLLGVFAVTMALLRTTTGRGLRLVGYVSGGVSAVWLTIATLALAEEDQRESTLHLAARVGKIAPPTAEVWWQTYIMPGPIVLTALVWIALAVYAWLETRSRPGRSAPLTVR
ncbi:serine/threonine-protein kinase [Catenulispora subtropica]|uniref:serine/threonine-protein kinase n=1 Tax=Catenulispora subtropica TaxID=450798 RepID=UPI0031D726BD